MLYNINVSMEPKFKLDSVGFYPIHRDKVEFSFGGVVSLRNLGLISHNNTKRCSDLRLA